MKTAEFNQNFEICRKSRGVKAMPKHGAPLEASEIITADGTAYDANELYHFFDTQTQQIRQSTGLRRDGDYLCTFGLRVIAVASLRANRDGALADGQTFFTSEVERLQKRIADYELEKSGDKRSLKAFLMAKE